MRSRIVDLQENAAVPQDGLSKEAPSAALLKNHVVATPDDQPLRPHVPTVIQINTPTARRTKLTGMSTDGTRESLFHRIGGTNGVRGLVDRFYARVLADRQLKPYFDRVELDKLRRMQFEFFCAALGGPIRYSGRTIVYAHQGRHITRPDFQAFVEHLLQTLKEYALDDDEIYTIIARVNTYADDVISGGVGLDT